MNDDVTSVWARTSKQTTQTSMLTQCRHGQLSAARVQGKQGSLVAQLKCKLEWLLCAESMTGCVQDVSKAVQQLLACLKSSSSQAPWAAPQQATEALTRMAGQLASPNQLHYRRGFTLDSLSVTRAFVPTQVNATICSDDFRQQSNLQHHPRGSKCVKTSISKRLLHAQLICLHACMQCIVNKQT